MRIAFAGPITRLDPVVLVFTASTTFEKASYPGYIYYDVIAIGAGGGRGGGCSGEDTHTSDILIRNFGGAGGGGGFHRVQGLVEILDDSIEIIVGDPGADGTDDTDPGSTTDGEDGGFSQFDFCGASGGLGGKRAVSCSISENMEADGGDGGLGGQTDAGYGGAGGICGKVDPRQRPGTNGRDGALRLGPIEFREDEFTAGGWIGAGGGGGPGGIAMSPNPFTEWSGHVPFARSGGNGSYDSDELVFGSGGAPTLELEHYMQIIPGIGGGARITPLNRLTKMYGGGGQPGVVAIKLSVD